MGRSSRRKNNKMQNEMVTMEDKEQFELWMYRLSDEDKQRLNGIQASMKSGKMILIVGVFCPLFWISLFSGQSISVILFNFTHSALYIAIGYYLIKKGKKSINEMIKGN